MRLILPIWILLLHMTCAWGLLIPQETRMGAEGWAAYSPSSTSTSTQASRSATRTVNYTYDDLHRLTGEVLGGSEETGTVAYTLDDVGNRLGRTSSVSGITPQSLSYSANDWLNSHQYDANGNTLRSDLTSGSVARDAYDFKNRLSQRRIYDASGTVLQKIVDLRYDGDGSLKWKRVTDTTTGEETIRYFVVDHHNLTGYSQIVEELDATGAVVATYHYGHDLISQSRLVVDETTGSSDWVDRLFVYDGGGSVRALTDLEGNVTDTFSYDSFGNLLHPSSLILHTFYLYRGERYDPDLAQYYLRARFYNSDLGRFHTLDEYEGRTGEPLSLHKYLYAHANPVTGLDPSGRFTLNDLGISTKMQAVIQNMGNMVSAGMRLRSYASTLVEVLDLISFASRMVYAVYAPTSSIAKDQIINEIMRKLKDSGSGPMIMSSFNAVFDKLKDRWKEISSAIVDSSGAIAEKASTYVLARMNGYLKAESQGRLRFQLFLPSAPGNRSGDLPIKLGKKYELMVGKTGGRLFGLGLRTSNRNYDQAFRIDYWDVRGGFRNPHVHYHIGGKSDPHYPIWSP